MMERFKICYQHVHFSGPYAPAFLPILKSVARLLAHRLQTMRWRRMCEVWPTLCWKCSLVFAFVEL
jgi:hypothetical protein